MEVFQQNNSAENQNNLRRHVEYLDSFPPGYRFCPTEAELILYYLKRKVYGQNLPPNKIADVDIYLYNPHSLAERFRPCGEKEWYFFSPRNKKYKNGKRPNRAAGDGYWKATGVDKRVRYHGEIIGLKRALVFYMGKPGKGEKTNWIMQEFLVADAPAPQRQHQDDMKLDHWVLCKIYHKNRKSAMLRLKNGRNEEQVLNQNNEGAQGEETGMVDTNNTVNNGAYIDHSHMQGNNNGFQQQQNSIVPYISTNFEAYGSNIVDDKPSKIIAPQDEHVTLRKLSVDDYSFLNLDPEYEMLETRSFDHEFGAPDDWIILNDPKDVGMYNF